MSLIDDRNKSDKIKKIVLKAIKDNLGDKAEKGRKIIESINMANKTIDRTHDIPFLAGSNNDGTITYIDKRIPEKIIVAGKEINPAKYLNVHEQSERALMTQLKIPYLKAHKVATAYEKALVQADSIDWNRYEKIMDGYIRETEYEQISDLPKDLYKKPYQEMASDAKPKDKPSITINAIHPNKGIQAAYKKKLDALIDEMQHSLIYWITAAYKANTPEMANDASPAKEMQKVIRKLTKRWNKKFDEASKELADYFATKISDRADGALESILKKSGFSVDFKMTAEMNDVMQASIAEQVGLIKSIAQEHLTQIEGIVMRSVSQGRNLKYLSDELQKRYGVTKRRAALIARDQNNKMTANFVRVRQQGVGATQAIWVHSHGGKTPRPSHVKAGQDKLVYEIEKGAYLDGKWVWPGTEINCRCVSKTIIPMN